MPNKPMPENLSSPDLECVMLDVDPLNIRESFGEGFSEDDLFYGETPELKYAQGAVAEKNARLTLLFGIHPSKDYRRNVDAVLREWVPEDVFVDHVSFFPSSVDGQDYNVIVGKVTPLPNLLEGRARLEVLDYTDKFPDYSPHITLAYIKGSASLTKWIERMDAVFGNRTYAVNGINYGDDD